MQVHVNTDNHVDVGAAFAQRIQADVETTLSRFSEQLTRAEIHLGDENGQKSGSTDKRCMLEARPAGQQPVAVTHHAASVDEACSGALTKLETLLETKYGRSDDRKGGQSIRHLPVGEGQS